MKSLIVVNNEKVEVFLNEDSLKSPSHKTLFEKVNKNIKGPQFVYTIGSADQFQKQLEKALENNPTLMQQLKVYTPKNINAWISMSFSSGF